MAQTSPEVGTAAEESSLKEELRRLVGAIVDGDDYSVETADCAVRILSSLKALKLRRRSVSVTVVDAAATDVVPGEFRCPVSGDLMRDPVVLATGQTYDRSSIQKWLKDGKRTCPQTQQVLSHTLLTPNHLVRDIISQWCKDHGMDAPNLGQESDDDVITGSERTHLNSLLEKMSSSLPDQKEAARQLRLLTKRMPLFRALFSESSYAIPQLLYPLSPGRANANPDLQEDLIATVLNLSIHDNNKKLVAENPLVMTLLIESLKFGSVETRSCAAATLFTLSALDSNKHIIGESGALEPLIGLLETGHPLAMKDAASAIFNLCLVPENQGRAVREGAIGVILKKIMDGVLVDELLAILAILSRHQKAVEEMGEVGAVSCLLSVMKENTCERNKENCAVILYAICLSDRSKLWEIREEENASGTLSRLAETGTSRAKRKANGILERLEKAASLFSRSA